MRWASPFAITGAWLLALACGGRSVSYSDSRSDGENGGAAGSAQSGTTSAGGTTGPAGGATGTSGSSGGTDVSPPTGCDCRDAICTASLQDFCDIVLCPVSKNGAWYDPGLCANHAERTTYSACSDGSSRFRWNWGFDTDYEVVFAADGGLVYGAAPLVSGGRCIAGFQTPSVDCRTCDYCPNEAGATPDEPPPCVVDETGRISPP